MSSVLTLYLNNPQQSGSSAGLLDLTQPTASTSTTGWNMGTTSLSFPFSLMSYNVEKLSGAFNTNPIPASGPVTAAAHFAQDSWRLSVLTSGTFSAGTWYSSGSMIAVTNASSQQGRLNMRLWRSSSVSGAGAVELTKGRMVGSITGALSTTVAKSSSASTQIGAVTLTNEYLFMNLAWEITTVATNAGADADFRFGPITDLTNGSFVVTPPFTPTGGGGATPSGAGFYVHRKQYDLVN